MPRDCALARLELLRAGKTSQLRSAWHRTMKPPRRVTRARDPTRRPPAASGPDAPVAVVADDDRRPPCSSVVRRRGELQTLAQPRAEAVSGVPTGVSPSEHPASRRGRLWS
jgi:hypothetical protein